MRRPAFRMSFERLVPWALLPRGVCVGCGAELRKTAGRPGRWPITCSKPCRLKYVRAYRQELRRAHVATG
jgi:hypothetical protein